MQLFVGLVGATIGNFIAPGIGGQIGFAIGSYAASALFAEDTNIQGPRINDAAVTTSAYGQTLPRVWGVFPVAGNVIDASPVREVATTNTVSGGKGGPETTQTTYTYFGDIAVAVHDGEIEAVLQIRANGRIIFDASPGAQVVRPAWLKFKLYRGTETQPPDPTFEALHGAAEVSAYRGTAYVVFEDFPFSQFGNQFAISFEFLLAVSASSSASLQQTTVSIVGEPSSNGGAIIEPSTGLVVFPIQRTTSQTLGMTAVDPYSREVVWQTGNGGGVSWRYASLKPKLISTPLGLIAVPGEIAACINTGGDPHYFVRIDAVSGEIIDTSPAKSLTGPFIHGMVYDWWDENPGAEPYYLRDAGVINGMSLLYGWDSEQSVAAPSGWYFSTLIGSNGRGEIIVGLRDVEYGALGASAFGVAVLDTATKGWSPVVSVPANAVFGAYADGSWWLFVDIAPANLYNISSDGQLIQAVNFDTDYGITDTVQPSMAYSQAENAIFIQGTGTLYKLFLDALDEDPIQYPVAVSTPVSVFHDQTCRAWYAPFNQITATSTNLCALLGQVATLDQVVSDLSLSGTQLESSDIDVTDLSSIDVRGFGVTSPMARRNAIAALQAAYLFDYVPRGGALTAILRGQTASATLDDDDIGAHIAGASAPEPWAIKRRPGASLPQQVEVRFIDPDHNYEPGTQLARRQAATGGTVERLELPVVLSNDEAAQVADTYIHLAHIESESYETTTMPSTIDSVRPAEVLSADVDGVSYTFRITSGSVVDGRILQLQATREVPEVFVSYAVGGAPRAPGGSVAVLGNTILWPLDAPALRRLDDSPGVYLAASSFSPNWPGCVVQRSTDGASWVAGSAIASSSAMGSAINAPSGGTPVTWDTETTLNVSLINGSLASTDRTSPTYFAWGQNGRLEICAFLTATQHADGYWQISNIARGLLDTGSNCDSHEIGDWFVVLDDQTMARFDLPLASIGQIEMFRGVTIGATPASAIPARIAFSAQGLKPFAPVRLHAERDGSDNWDISWARQERLIGRKFWAQPNSEASEAYTLKFYNESGSVKKTATVTGATTYQFTQADQVASFGAKQSELWFSIAQISAVVGDGAEALAYVGANFGYIEALIDDGALLLYAMDEDSGTVCANSASASYDGEYVGSPTLGAGGVMVSGQSVDLSGSGQYIDIDNDTMSQDYATSIEFAFYCDALPLSGEMALLSTQYYNFGAGTQTQFVTVTINSSGSLIFRAYGFGSTPGPVRITASGAALSAATAYHVLINFTSGISGSATVYVNGASYATGASGGNWSLQPGRIRIGTDLTLNTHADFDGRIDNVSFWTSNQSAGQIADHYLRSGIT